MERWDGTVLDINATCADLGEKCLQLLGVHTCSDTVSYPYGKGKISALNTLLSGDFPGLAHEHGEVEATHTDLWKWLKHISVLFIVSLARPQWKMLVSNYLLRRKPQKS